MRPGKTGLLAVFGDPVRHSLSPRMQNAALGKMGLPFRYLSCRVPASRLAGALEEAGRLGFRGVNLTIPLKERAAPLMDRLTPEARGAGAVNTVTFRSGKTEGHSTDGEGFLRAAREELGFLPRGSSVVMLGAGGASRSISWALAKAGAGRIVLVNRTLGRAERLAAHVRSAGRLSVTAVSLCGRNNWRALLGEAGLLVNTTPLGMHGEKSPVPAAALHRRLRVADLTYNPPDTDLLRAARRRRVPVMNGLGMLVHQGALSFSRWTGRKAPVSVMRRALLAVLNREQRKRRNNDA